MTEEHTPTQPKVTVVIPSYNHAGYVSKAIESVLKQTYPNIQLMVFDDGSRDESPEIIARLAKQHDFFFRYQSNQGLTATLNDALTLSEGDYFCPLSSDDIMFPDRIETLVGYMETHPEVALCGGAHQIIDAEDNPVGQPNIRPAKTLDFDDVFLHRAQTPSAATILIRTEVLVKLGGYDTHVALEDFDLDLKITHAGYKIAYLDKVLGYYRRHDSNTMKQRERIFNSLMTSLDKYADHPGYEKAVNYERASYLLKTAHKNKSLALKILRRIPLRYYNLRVVRGLFQLAFFW